MPQVKSRVEAAADEADAETLAFRAHAPSPSSPTFRKHLGRRPVESRERHVADVTEVAHAFRRRVEAADRQVAISREEPGGRLEPGIRLRQAADVVADRGLARRTRVGKTMPEAPRRLGIEPLKSLEDDLAIPGIVLIRRADPFIDEIDDADGGGAWRSGVRRQDEIAQHRRRAPLGGRERERPQVSGRVDPREIGIRAIALGRGGRRACRSVAFGERVPPDGGQRSRGGDHPLDRGPAVDAKRVAHVRVPCAASGRGCDRRIARRAP